MTLLLPPTKMPLSPARSTTIPATRQYDAFRARPRLAGSSFMAEKLSTGFSPAYADSVLRALEVPLLPGAMVIVWLKE
jgi:hypothetical protein